MISAVVVGVLSITLFVVSVTRSKTKRKFGDGKSRGQARVVGYTNSEGSSREFLLVEIIGINNKTYHQCATRESNPSARYPIGAIVDVEYTSRKFLGVEFYDIHPLEDHWESRNGSGGALLWVALSLLLITAGLLGAYVVMKSR